VDGHALQFTAYLAGQPDLAGDATAVVFTDAIGTNWRGEARTNVAKGICKKSDVLPRCELGYSPLGLGMSSGFVTDFYYIGHTMKELPAGVIQDGAPNFESITDAVPFFDTKDFKSVDPSIPDDMLAGTFTGMISIETAGKYTFSTTSNAGSHLYIDGAMVVNNGGLHSTKTESGTVDLAEGYHMIKADWFENGGGPSMALQYNGPDTGGQEADVQATHFQRQSKNLPDPLALGMKRGWQGRIWFFDGALSKVPPNLDSIKPDLLVVNPNLDLGNEEFKALGCPDDRFAAVFTGSVQIWTPGFYDFWTESDDGSHLYVDGIMVVSNGGLHGPVKKKGKIRLSHGIHFLMVDFFENAGGALLKVHYSGADTYDEESEIDAWLPPASPAGTLSPGAQVQNHILMYEQCR
jgi:hypothetical protein